MRGQIGAQPAIANDILGLEKKREIGERGHQQEGKDQPSAQSAARKLDRAVEEAVAIGHQEQGEGEPGPGAALEFELDAHQPIDAEDAPGQEYAERRQGEKLAVPDPAIPGDVGQKQGHDAAIELPGRHQPRQNAGDLAERDAEAPADGEAAQQGQADQHGNGLGQGARPQQAQQLDGLAALPGRYAGCPIAADEREEGEARGIPDIAGAPEELAPAHLPGAERRHALAVPGAARDLLGHQIGGPARAPEDDQ